MIWRMKRLKKLKTLIFSMIKVGCMGFGGGNALIPVIEEEAVKDKKLEVKRIIYWMIIFLQIYDIWLLAQ